MLPPKGTWYRKIVMYFVVTDMWFDPVAGQDDPLKGSMIGYAQINDQGGIGKKRPILIRGLASQGYEYADIDYIALCKTRLAAFENQENIVGIGHGNTIRARPKTPGRSI